MNDPNTSEPVKVSMNKHFIELQHRLLVTLNHIRLAADHFGDLSQVGIEDVPACMTPQEAADELDDIYDGLDQWSVGQHVGKGAQP